jgi:hypothetical protein
MTVFNENMQQHNKCYIYVVLLFLLIPPPPRPVCVFLRQILTTKFTNVGRERPVRPRIADSNSACVLM